MNIYTYYKQDNQLNDFRPLLDLWSKAWSKAGFNQVIIEEEPVEHPNYNFVCELLQDLPSINPKTYTDNNIKRWLAMDLIGSGLHVDSDVLPSQSPQYYDNIFTIFNEHTPTTLLQSDIVPCAVWWEANTFDWVKNLSNYAESKSEVNGKLHYSDQYMFRHLIGNGAKINTANLCGTYKYEDDWYDYPMIHFPTNNLPVGPKHESIQAVWKY